MRSRFYVDQFNKFGRVFQIGVQADSPFRLQSEDIRNMTARNKNGDVIPLGTLVHVTPVVGPSPGSHKGSTLLDDTVDAARARFRPILMILFCLHPGGPRAAWQCCSCRRFSVVVQIFEERRPARKKAPDRGAGAAGIMSVPRKVGRLRRCATSAADRGGWSQFGLSPSYGRHRPSHEPYES